MKSAIKTALTLSSGLLCGLVTPAHADIGWAAVNIPPNGNYIVPSDAVIAASDAGAWTNKYICRFLIPGQYGRYVVGTFEPADDSYPGCEYSLGHGWIGSSTTFDVLVYQSAYPAADTTLQFVPMPADGSLPADPYLIDLILGDDEYVCLTSRNLSNFIGATFPLSRYSFSRGCHIAVDGAEYTMPNYQIMTTVIQPLSSSSGFGGGGGGTGTGTGGHRKPNPQ